MGLGILFLDSLPNIVWVVEICNLLISPGYCTFAKF